VREVLRLPYDTITSSPALTFLREDDLIRVRREEREERREKRKMEEGKDRGARDGDGGVHVLHDASDIGIDITVRIHNRCIDLMIEYVH